jgi:hypothetical protein
MAWAYRDQSKTMGGVHHERVVEPTRYRLLSATQSLGVPCLAHRVGDLEREYAEVFNNKISPSFIILDKIKGETRLWVYAGLVNWVALCRKSDLGAKTPSPFYVCYLYIIVNFSLINRMRQSFCHRF